MFLKRKLLKLIPSLIGCVLLVSCLGPRLMERPPVTAETQDLAAEMYAKVWQYNQGISTVRGEAELRMSRGIFSRATQQYILVKRPDQLRLDSHDALGSLIAQLVYTDGVLYFSEPPTGYFRSSDEDSTLLREEFGLDIPITDLLLLVSAGIPLEDKDNYLAVTRSGEVLLRGLRSQIQLDEESGLPKRYAARLSNGTLYEVQFRHYEFLDGVWFPTHIAVALSDPNVGLNIGYQQVELNIPIEPDLFAPPVIPVEVEWEE